MAGQGETRTVVIDQRFCGPPDSANGGYTAGIVAGVFGNGLGPVEVRLRKPPPLERELLLTSDGRLLDGDEVVAEGRAAALTIDVPEPPSLDEATEASSRYIGFQQHHFPTCFTCGPDRDEHDGLRVFPGRLRDRDVVAAPWTPSGEVAAPMIWAALDCPGFFGNLRDDAVAVLGTITARIDRLATSGEPHIAIGWPLGGEGRKLLSGSAVFTAAGELVACSSQVWISIG